MADPTIVLDVSDVGDVVVCPDDAAPARRRAGETVFSYHELDALDAARDEGLIDVALARTVARVKKTFPSATIDRILTAKEAALDAESRWGIPAGDPRRQVGVPPRVVSTVCPACGGDGKHLPGCMLDS